MADIAEPGIQSEPTETGDFTFVPDRLRLSVANVTRVGRWVSPQRKFCLLVYSSPLSMRIRPSGYHGCWLSYGGHDAVCYQATGMFVLNDMMTALRDVREGVGDINIRQQVLGVWDDLLRSFTGSHRDALVLYLVTAKSYRKHGPLKPSKKGLTLS
jgi:hypothetical protein